MSSLSPKLCLAFIVIFFSGIAQAQTALKYDTQFILEVVLEKMGHKFDPTKPVPKILFGSEVPIEQFQDDIEPQWGIRPHVVLNVFIADLNVIYLLDDPEYYKKTRRFIEDSLAHELVHYVQVMYENTNIDHAGDHIEFKAVEIQTWFREQYMHPAQISKDTSASPIIY